VDFKWAVVSAWMSASTLGVAVATTMACSPGMASTLDRPATSSEAAVARVLHVQGAVVVKPAAGKSFTARANHDLVRTDELEAAEGAFSVLLLRNGHAVRVDDTGALAVADILLVNAPATSTPVERQLAQLLDPGETAAFPATAVRERAAAWRLMIRAGETAGGASESRAREASSPGAGAAPAASAPPAKAAAPSPSPSPSPPPPPPPPPPSPSPPKGSRQAAKADMARDESRDTDEKKSTAKVDANAGLAPSEDDMAPAMFLQARFGTTLAVARATGTPTTLPPSMGDGQALRGCINDVVSVDMLPPSSTVEVWLQVKDGVVVRVRLSGALPVPVCAQTLLNTPISTANGWVVLQAPRP
jgi:hypothetical protein